MCVSGAPAKALASLTANPLLYILGGFTVPTCAICYMCVCAFSFVQLYEESLTDHEGRYPGTASDVFWQFSVPDGLRSTLTWIGRRYQRPEVSWWLQHTFVCLLLGSSPLKVATHIVTINMYVHRAAISAA
jgi:hypothetical protein